MKLLGHVSLIVFVVGYVLLLLFAIQFSLNYLGVL